MIRRVWVDIGGIDKYGIIWPLICIDKPPNEWVDYVTGKRIAREHFGRFKEFIEAEDFLKACENISAAD